MIDPLVQGTLAAATFALSLKLTGDHTPETPWWRRMAGIGYGTFGLWLGFMLLSSNVAVVRDSEVTVLSRGPGWVVMSMSSNKVRSNCELRATRPDNSSCRRAIAVPSSRRTMKMQNRWQTMPIKHA